MLQWLCARPEQRIAVVSHSGFLTQLFSQFGMSTHVNMASKDLRELHRRPLHAEMRGVCLAAHRPFNTAEIERGSEHATSLLRDPKLPKDKGEDKDAARRGPPPHEAAATVQMPLPPPRDGLRTKDGSAARPRSEPAKPVVSHKGARAKADGVHTKVEFGLLHERM